MFVVGVITVLSAASIAFYARFLFALCKECKPHRIGHWLRLRLVSGEKAMAERSAPVSWSVSVLHENGRLPTTLQSKQAQYNR
jgi:hypothetical protein